MKENFEVKKIEEIISENIQKLLDEYDLNQKELANIAKVSESTVGKWLLKKATPRMGAVERIANHFNIPKSYILQEGNALNLYPIEGRRKIPVLGEIACGDPIVAEENVEYYIEEPANNLPKGELYYLKAKGNSMEPTIPSDALVLIRQQDDVESGEIAAVLLNGDTEATLKRVRKYDDSIFLMPDNSEHEPIIVNENNPAKIIGKAVRITFDL